jgi:hypothetical protein
VRLLVCDQWTQCCLPACLPECAHACRETVTHLPCGCMRVSVFICLDAEEVASTFLDQETVFKKWLESDFEQKYVIFGR